ncbi:MAG: phosphoenolpyruvate--protein phosphotransferase [Syntrophales bacterium]|nr:phosphoenolpyruvate--protein phosphotransferase [Syntrophales bacterium]
METVIIKGVGVSPGIVIGKAYVYDRLDAQISLYSLNGSEKRVYEEVRRLKKAIKDSELQLKELKKKFSASEGLKPLYIIDVHLMLLRDRSFIDAIVNFIREMGVNAEWAVRLALDKYREIFDRIDDEYIKERFNDVRYVGQMILRNLAGKGRSVKSQTGENIIVIATDLSPADTAQMMIDRVLGFATDMGSRTSHTAIVARSLEIPAVVGLEKVTRLVKTNDTVILDGSAGVLIINPDPEVLRRYEEKSRLYKESQKEFLKDAKLPAITKDGFRIAIGGNIEFIEEIPTAISYGAEGIGLYRTEFIYINRETLPTEEEHFSSYSRVVSAEGISWATIRTFDLGGDKFYSDPKLAKEMNPQMGLRAIRFCLKEVDLFKVQIRAILRASSLGKTRILFPMISSLEEIRQAKVILEEEYNNLVREGFKLGKDFEVGVMIEVPSAVVIADALAKEADFFSIGTNDLIQYTLAIDRINERVSYLYEPLHPAVIRLIKNVIDVAHDAGIKVAMCGEMAGDPLYVMVLLGLGLDELSMNPLAIPKIKSMVRKTTLEESRRLLKDILPMSSAKEIRQQVEKTMQEYFPDEFHVVD